MDPRHPEQAVSRLRELVEQYNRVEKDMGNAFTSAELAQLEREGGLVIQEICLVAPRIHEAMMQTSRIRRAELAKGLVEKPVEKPVVIEKLVETELDKEVNEVLKSLELDKEIEEKEEQEIKQSPKKKTTKRKKAE